MNRIIKKALSFMTAAAITVTCCAASISAASGSAKATMTAIQVLDNKYALAVGLDNGAFYASAYSEEDSDDGWSKKIVLDQKAELVRVNSSGKVVKVPNTIGFDGVYDISSSYIYRVNNPFTEAYGKVLGLSKNGKTAVLLENGTLLNDGKLYDSASSRADLISVVSGTTNEIYTMAGKKLCSVKTSFGSLAGYNSANNILFFVKLDEKKYCYTFTPYNVKTGKSISIELGGSDSYINIIKGVDKKTLYLKAYNSTTYETTYYTTSFKKADANKAEVQDKLQERYKSGKILLVDSSGKTIESFDAEEGKGECYSPCLRFSGNYIHVLKNKTYTVYNRKTGKTVFTQKNVSGDIDNVCDDKALLRGGEYPDYKYTYFTGSKLISIDGYTNVTMPWGGNGSLIVSKEDTSSNDDYDYNPFKYGVIGIDGTLKIKCQYDSINYTKNAYIVRKENKETYSSTYGVVSSDGKTIVKMSYKDIQFAGDKFYIVNDKNNKYGVLKADGSTLIKRSYSSIYYSREDGYFHVTNSNYKQGIISTSGKVIVKPKYDSVTVKDDYFVANSSNSKTAIINKSGKVVITADYGDVQTVNEQLALIKMGDSYSEGKYNVYNTVSGKLVKGNIYAVSTWGAYSLKKCGKIYRVITSDKYINYDTKDAKFGFMSFT